MSIRMVTPEHVRIAHIARLHHGMTCAPASALSTQKLLAIVSATVGVPASSARCVATLRPTPGVPIATHWLCQPPASESENVEDDGGATEETTYSISSQHYALLSWSSQIDRLNLFEHRTYVYAKFCKIALNYS